MKIIENDNNDRVNDSDNDDKHNNNSDNDENNDDDNNKIPVDSPHKGPIMLNFDVTFVESKNSSRVSGRTWLMCLAFSALILQLIWWHGSAVY